MDEPTSIGKALKLSRRNMIGGAVVSAATATVIVHPSKAEAAVSPTLPAVTGDYAATIAFALNGRKARAEIDLRTSLLDMLREQLHLTGAKKGCDQGQCGACTVHVDGQRVASCLTLAVKVADRSVTTIEGLSRGGKLHPMQQAFIDNDALQCGYCTPGQIMAAVACVNEGNATSRERIREYMSGNICRCGAYPGIVAAIEQVVAEKRGGNGQG